MFGRLALVASLCVLTGVASTARAQIIRSIISPTIAQVFDRGTVNAIAVQADGKVIIGGSFTYVGNTPRNNIARINTDGSLDTTWDPNPNGSVALLLMETGNVYVAGGFTSIGGQSRNGLAKLSTSDTGTADATWNPTPSAVVHALALDGSGNLYVGGQFTFIGGLFRNRIAKLSTTGTGAADATWNPNTTSGDVKALALDGIGNIYAGGTFTNIGSQARNNVAKLSTSGTGAADATWNPSPFAVDSLGNLVPSSVFALAVDGSGVYIPGCFTNIGGQTRYTIAWLSPSGAGPADSWAPNVNVTGGGSVLQLALDGGGFVYAGGSFGSIGGENRRNLAKLSTSGGGVADLSWNPSPDGIVSAVALGGGKVYVGGQFRNIGAQIKGAFAALSASSTGTADPAWPMALSAGTISAIVRDTGSGTIIGGSFIVMGDMTTVRLNIARFSADNGLDATWNPSADGSVSVLVVDGSGSVYVGGSFFSIGGLGRNRIAKLSTSGTGAADATWNPNANGAVLALALDGGGSVYAGGAFSNIGGQTRNNIAKLSTGGAGAADAAWNPNASSSIFALAVVGGGVYAGGQFTSIGGQTRNRIAKLSPSFTGAADPTWNPNMQSTVFALALDGSGYLYAGGQFTTIGLVSGMRYIARLSTTTTGAPDTTWHPLPNAGGYVHALALDGSGNIYAGGEFTTIGGLSRNRIAKLSTSGTGAADATWNPNANGTVLAVALDGSGNVYAGGQFTIIDSQSRAGYAVVSTATPSILSVVSRKSHAAAGSFDIPINSAIPIAGAIDVEPRVIASGHSIIFSFNSTITSAGTVSATDVNDQPIGSASALATGNTVVVSLTGIPDNTRVKISLTNVNGSFSVSASAGFLVGDVDPLGGSRSVDTADIDAIKGVSGQTTNGTNFRYDLNLSGAITAADILAAKGRDGLTLP